ncbi:hypothetical protein DFP72DRAFT_1073013 [Ephemerocybe angulata]|uniref:Uncharacterized protein n=1 Tax=Ephemerocybe angulata TaxID=980116 RepID=A0A8H6HNC8_9AGAR|nr:hypothetical protein DFP72DRAFT_1073013 [Tulosesus angulatus]
MQQVLQRRATVSQALIFGTSIQQPHPHPALTPVPSRTPSKASKSDVSDPVSEKKQDKKDKKKKGEPSEDDGKTPHQIELEQGAAINPAPSRSSPLNPPRSSTRRILTLSLAWWSCWVATR